MHSNQKKRTLVIASVLKPVDDTRMFEKMGVSLAKENCKVFIIGQAWKVIPAHPNIHFVPFQNVKRISLGRVVLPFQIGLKILQLKPEALIVNTHELLIVSLLNRILFGAKIVYDIRENYYRNIIFSESFTAPVKNMLAALVRLKEKLTAPLFHHFFLAEKVYRKELTFIGSRYTVLENKAIPDSSSKRQSPRGFKLLFTGTVARSTGVFEAISLAESLHKINPDVTLTIIGYCALQKVGEELKKAVQDKPFVQLKGIDQLVPHSEIIQAINTADFGIICYPYSPHTFHAMPTKLFEYMAGRLPILTWQDQRFADMVVTNKAGLLANPEANKLMDEMKSSQFYPEPINGIYWEGDRLIGIINKLLPVRQN